MLCYNVALILIWSFFFDDKSTGNLMHSIGGIIVSILAKFWIAMVWYLICLWCLTTVFTLIIIK